MVQVLYLEVHRWLQFGIHNFTTSTRTGLLGLSTNLKQSRKRTNNEILIFSLERDIVSIRNADFLY